MPMNFRKALPACGGTLPRRRFTGGAVLYFLMFLRAPVRGIALLPDILIYPVFTHFFDRCDGALCLPE